MVFGATLFVLGCAEIGFLGAMTPPPATAIALYDGAITATAPEQYCIDPKSANPDRGFTMMVACEVMTGGPKRPDLNGLVVVQAGDVGSAIVGQNPDAIETFLTTPAGRDMLSANGDASTLSIDGFQRASTAVTVQFTDQASPVVAGLQATEWRAFVDINGRLVTISVRGLADRPLNVSQGQALLKGAIMAMLNNNQTSETVIDT